MDQLPFDYPITLCVGASWDETFYVLDDAGLSALRAGCTASLVVKSALDGTTLLTFTTENGKLALDVDLGTIIPTTLPTDMDALTGIPAVYGLRVTYANGLVSKMFAGKANIQLGA